MTWVIGMSGPGQVIGVSDIQVTWKKDNLTLDCLQKIYPAGPYVAVGFSGAVKLGMQLVGDLQTYLYVPQGQEGCWLPGTVLYKWRRQARRLFKQASSELQELGCSLMVLAVYWKEEWGETLFPKTAIAILRPPEFLPEWIGYKQCVSIGSGNHIEEYREYIAGRNRRPFDLWQMEVGMPGGAVGTLGFTAGKIVQEHPATGVSSHMHNCLIRWGSIQITTNDWTQISSEEQPTYHTMPKVAKTWKDFTVLCQEKGLSEAQAIC